MKCPYCDNEVPVNATTCPSCGASVPQQQTPPPQQQQYVQQPQVVVQMGAQQPQKSSRSRVAYILLALFLGGLGIHNFYAGRTGAGVVQLLLTLFTSWLIFPLFIVGLWVLIEIFVVTTDGNGLRFS